MNGAGSGSLEGGHGGGTASGEVKEYAVDDFALVALGRVGSPQSKLAGNQQQQQQQFVPSNSYVASTGEVFEVEPFMLPPPSEIASLMAMVRERQSGGGEHGRRDRGDSSLGLNDGGSPGGAVGSSKELHIGDVASPSLSRKLSTMTPFSPATMNGTVEWMAPGKPRGLLQANTPIPARINTTNLPLSPQAHGSAVESSADESSDAGCDTPPPKRGGIVRTTFPHGGEYRGRTSSAPAFSQMMASAAKEVEQQYQQALQHSQQQHHPLNGHGDNGAGESPKNQSHGGLPRGSSSLGASQDSNDAGSGAATTAGAAATATTMAPHLTEAREKFSDVFSKQAPPADGEYFHIRKFSLLKYLQVEMFGVGESEKSERRSPDTISNFLAVPFKIERMVWFGFFVCFDAFWYTVTYLPIRVVYSLYVLIKELVLVQLVVLLPGLFWFPGALLKGPGLLKVASPSRYFHRTHAYDLMVGALMWLAVSSLQMLNMGRVYHFIRGQNMIKLYVLTGMLEIFDKLLSSFGQDAFDSLYSQTRRYQQENDALSNIVFSFVVVAFYVMLHSGIYFIHIATLTVAINSAEQALITVLILNNFAEIKSFVFKKFDKQNLFQLACSDITERFQLCLFLTTITAVAFAQSESFEAGVKQVLPSHCFVVAIMVAGESVADWVKHAFISKFNFIDASVYDDFMRVLRKDILNSHKDKVILNHTYAITRRVGLSQIPLGAVAVRYLILALSSASVRAVFYECSQPRRLAYAAAVFTGMVLLKIFIGVALVLVAGHEHNKELDAKAAKLQKAAETGSKLLLVKRESLAQLSNIERYTVYRGKVLG